VAQKDRMGGEALERESRRDRARIQRRAGRIGAGMHLPDVAFDGQERGVGAIPVVAVPVAIHDLAQHSFLVGCEHRDVDVGCDDREERERRLALGALRGLPVVTAGSGGRTSPICRPRRITGELRGALPLEAQVARRRDLDHAGVARHGREHRARGR
jgi:hypothetical protein